MNYVYMYSICIMIDIEANKQMLIFIPKARDRTKQQFDIFFGNSRRRNREGQALEARGCIIF